MIKKILTICLIGLAAGIAGCASNVEYKDYTAFRADNPRSILVVPALNNTVSVEAPDFFHSTVSRPFAERGYYVFPANMMKRLLEEEGLADAGLVHSADPTRLGRLFECGAILYIVIDRWESQYAVLVTTTNVEFTYTLKSCRTGETLWEHNVARTYTPDSSSSGNAIADLIIMAATAAIERAAPNYIPLAQQANAAAAITPGFGLPAGPYLPESYNNDLDTFPSGSAPD
jgi:hypothetical protein